MGRCYTGDVILSIVAMGLLSRVASLVKRLMTALNIGIQCFVKLSLPREHTSQKFVNIVKSQSVLKRARRVRPGDDLFKLKNAL